MVGKPVLCARRNRHHVAFLHAGTLAADLREEFTRDKQKDLIAVLVSLRLLARCLPWSELHHRGLTSLRGLQHFEPLRRSIDIMTFHGAMDHLS